MIAEPNVEEGVTAPSDMEGMVEPPASTHVREDKLPRRSAQNRVPALSKVTQMMVLPGEQLRMPLSRHVKLHPCVLPQRLMQRNPLPLHVQWRRMISLIPEKICHQKNQSLRLHFLLTLKTLMHLLG